MIFFLHARDYSNTGDISSCPFQYFDFFKKYDHRFVDIADVMDRYGTSEMSYSKCVDAVTKDDVVIVGGGGLIGYCDEWHRRINEMTSKAGLAIGWGFGDNFIGSDKTSVRIDFSKFSILGLRDYVGNSGTYVPCVSCMYPGLKTKFQKKRKVGVVIHKDLAADSSTFPPGSFIATNAMSQSSLVRFIGECEKVMSPSYHVCYWAALMNVPCTAMNGVNSKIARAKFSHDWGDNSGFIDDCIDRNMKFSLEVDNLIRGFISKRR